MKTGIIVTIILFLSFTAIGAPLDLNFEHLDEAQYWRVTNDDVMGGVSSSTVEVRDNTLVFTGILRLENNGGFASIYRQQDSSVQLSQTAIKIRVKGDGRVYQLRLRTPESYGVSYSVSFPTQKDEWLEHTFMPENFNPVFRGRLVLGAPILDFRQVSRLGFLLADKNPGNFTLLVAKVYQ